MAKIFVSHASADYDYVEKFVDYILRIGCGLDGESLFFSSERDTGVPSGADLMNTVRTEVGEATLVIAIITPMYQSRPVCVAELGAAWGRSDSLFPIKDPSMKRVDLDGIVPSTLVLSLDDNDALDELFDRVGRALGKSISTSKWGAGKKKWLNVLKSGSISLRDPDVPNAAEHDALQKDLIETQEALQLTEIHLAEAERKCKELARAKDADEVKEILLPKDSIEKFKVLHLDARERVFEFAYVVRDAMYKSLRSELVAYPNAMNDPDAANDFADAVEREYLREEDDALYTPNVDKPKVEKAMQAVWDLQNFIKPETSGSEFAEWFEKRYEEQPALTDRDCWETLF